MSRGSPQPPRGRESPLPASCRWHGIAALNGTYPRSSSTAHRRRTRTGRVSAARHRSAQSIPALALVRGGTLAHRVSREGAGTGGRRADGHQRRPGASPSCPPAAPEPAADVARSARTVASRPTPPAIRPRDHGRHRTKPRCRLSRRNCMAGVLLEQSVGPPLVSPGSRTARPAVEAPPRRQQNARTQARAVLIGDARRGGASPRTRTPRRPALFA